MRLKKLELNGFKTFATQTELLFEEGITAVVGPNGSGKSNVADAIRWALGEQSYSKLRARRTEDMIFSGSERRARQGMARATLTLDNTTGWLPIEFSEVTIERRAFRSGENEYYLNDNRVRLRDINGLLGQSGLGQRTYTVIGQGLVDRALSLGPSERRALFEEASGITVYQSKRADALGKLEQTQQNIVRVNDIINEIAPRLRHLEQQAARAEEHQQVTARLDRLLRTWYGYRWQQSTQATRQARTVARHRRKSLRSAEKELDALHQQVAALRTRQGELRAALIRWHRESSDLHTRAEALQRDIAVSKERLRLLRAQRQELESELEPLQHNRQAQAARVQEAQEKLHRLESEVAAHRQAVTDAQGRLKALQNERQARLSALTAARDRAFALATQISDRDNRRAQLRERQTQIVQEQAEHGQKLSRLQGSLAAAEAAQTDLQEELNQLQADLIDLESRRTDQQQRLVQMEAQSQQLQAERVTLQHKETNLQDRQAALARMREEGEGYYAGVRSVLRAGRRLPGVVGVLAALIDVPAGLERAMEAALGARLQNIVVESWDDAVTAIAHLKQVQGGQATFLPLDTLRGRSPLQAGPVSGMEGVIGLASDLVSFKERLRPAVELTLGHTLIANDLDAARRAFDRLNGSFQIVTRAGEVLRSDGAVTGGTRRAARDGSLLAREREWRELPAALEALDAQIRAVTQKFTALKADIEAAQKGFSDLQSQIEGLKTHQADVARRVSEKERETGRLIQEITWLQDLIQGATTEIETLQARDEKLHAEEKALLEERDAVAEQMASLERALETLSADEPLAEVSHLRTSLAVAEQSQASQASILSSHRRTLEQLSDQLEARRRRIEALTQEADKVAARLTDLTARHGAVLDQLNRVQSQIAPAEDEIAALEARRGDLEAKEDTLKQRVRQYESRHNQAMLEVTRREEEIVSLRRQIEDDLGLVEPEEDESPRSQPPLPLRPLVSTLPSVSELPEGLEDEMRHLRARLRRLGSINPNAPEEYAEQLERRDFLVSQAEDLQKAAAQLREVIAELDDLMEEAFSETFEAVGEAFSGYFNRLFEGGTARLVMTDPNDVMESGIEIIARPPGKRSQTLALLSGGERALTATALIFAFLKVNPPPFSILDEVDAMLDEANVGRFVELLQEQAQSNQFIVITHNRITMKAAHTLYGVTMGDDSVSRVVSKKLENES